jgi:hypothetical protein
MVLFGPCSELRLREADHLSIAPADWGRRA